MALRVAVAVPQPSGSRIASIAAYRKSYNRDHAASGFPRIAKNDQLNMPSLEIAEIDKYGSLSGGPK
jgi:hypothetical protein